VSSSGVAGQTKTNSNGFAEQFDRPVSHCVSRSVSTKNSVGILQRMRIPRETFPYPDGFEEGWIVVADELNYTNPLVSTVMDEARRFIANETDRDEDITEKADTALVGLAAQLLDTEKTDHVVLLTTDKPAGRAAETLLPQHGFSDRIEFRYVSVEYLEMLTADEFR